MKELSIEEKAERYDEVIAMAKECITYIPDEAVNKYMLNMFPELQESDNEKIRKGIIKSIMDLNTDWLELHGVTKEDAIAWLEKQGEQKPVEWHIEDEQNLNACLGHIPDEFLRRWLKDVIHAKYDKSADKAEPKFKVGDWIIDKEGYVHQIENVVENVTNHAFGYDMVGGRYFNDNSDVHLWTIKDAKDGDVLVASDDSIFIYKCQRNNSVVHYIAVTSCNDLVINENDYGWENKNACHPATKEQRDLLFAKMKEAGYEWTADKKELKSK